MQMRVNEPIKLTAGKLATLCFPTYIEVNKLKKKRTLAGTNSSNFEKLCLLLDN